VPDLDEVAPAHYFVFAPATPIATPTPAQLVDPANYVRVEINRDRSMDYPKAATRTDCVGSVCTWAEEAQNFANWFTYYRTRLASAIAVTAESLSGLTRARSLDGLRLGYGSINYFPNGADPFSATSGRLPATMTIDGQASNGALVRGVRPFTEVTPPPAPGSDDRRQEVFDWLFSLRAIASTPNREALDSVGSYFRRTDNTGPWITPASATNWTSTENSADHISCRRNYTIMITDGEWTRAPWVPAAPQQPLVENTSTPLNALSIAGPTLTGLGGRTYTYNPATEVQFSTNASSAGGTLTDIAFYYWSRDLRADLTNNIRVVDPTAGSQGNGAFWQHLTPYLIGYGISASLDTDSTRQAIANSAVTPQAISWPAVRLEDRATETATIVTDRDTAPISCGYDAATNPAGCGRVDDTFRAGMAARGDFLAAADVSRLAQGVAAAFTAIGQIEGSATSLTGRSGTLQSGDRLFAASFRTNVWTGRLQSFDAVQYFQELAVGTTPVSVDSRFPAAASRNVLTSTASGTAAVFPTGAGDFGNLSTAQQAALNGDPTLAQWVRGDQSREARNGGPFRNRPLGELMGSIVNSQPIYSKAPDFGYQSARKPAADTSTGNAYRDYVNLNRAHRPARVYVGSNGGMLHAFDASGTPATNSNYMNEVFAYVPRAVYGSLSTLASPGYSHRYLVDGPIVEGDVFTGGAWRTVIVGTTGAGPKGVFAIDATQRSGSTATTVGTGNVLWDLTGADSATNIEHLGNIVQPGVIGSGRDGNWYYFVGNGYESTNDLAKLLAINITTGAIHVIDTDSVGGNDPTSADINQRPNGLGGVTPVYDANRNIVAIYGGDRLGRLWKFDLSSTNRSAWSSTQLFTAQNAASERQAITAAPRIIPHPLGGRMIVFGTGKIFERNDLSDMSVQSVYGVWERNPSSPVTVAKSSLRQLTLADQTATTGERFRQLNGTGSLNWATDLGWYFDLLVGTSNVGERVVASPAENFGFANVTTFEPSADGDPCLGGGRSFFYRLDVAGSFTRSPFAPTGGVANLPGTVPLNTVVGSELSTATVNQLQTLLRPVAGSPTTSTALTSAEMAAIAGGTAAAATNPCLQSQAGGQSLLGTAVSSPTLNCPVAPLRVWREMPRGPR
jgi:type IV pilus assembly protein PilY1